jgi:hypothetical protein
MDAVRLVETYGRRMSVRTTLSPEAGPPRSPPRERCRLVAVVAAVAIAVAGITIATADSRDASPSPCIDSAQPHDSWMFYDPRVQKGARGAPIP